jgi:hypothetical protein
MRSNSAAGLDTLKKDRLYHAERRIVNTLINQGVTEGKALALVERECVFYISEDAEEITVHGANHRITANDADLSVLANLLHCQHVQVLGGTPVSGAYAFSEAAKASKAGPIPRAIPAGYRSVARGAL